VLIACAIVSIAAVASAALPASEYVYTPAGRILKECHHRVPSGSRLSPANGGGLIVHDSKGHLIKRIPPCTRRNGTVSMFEPRGQRPRSPRHSRKLLQFPSDYEGWLAYTAFNYSQSFDAFVGKFSVPDIPSAVPDVLYLFTGLQNIDWIPVVDPEPTDPFDIIQPVLQYPGDAGDYWSVKSWYVTLDTGTVASDEIQLTPGDVIFGNMTRTGSDTWYVGSTSTMTAATTEVSVTHNRLVSQPWAYNTLECYGCSGCGTFPLNPIEFRELVLTANGTIVTPTWKINPKPSKLKQCNEIPVVNGPDSVDIDFQ